VASQNNNISRNSAGIEFPLPDKKDYQEEFNRLRKLAEQARSEGKEVVVVMGLGFVGVVMAAIVADTKGGDGKPSKFVIGYQRPSVRSYWKVPVVNEGKSPVNSEDPHVDELIADTVLKEKTFTATYNVECLKLADCVVVDVQCDFRKNDLGNMKTGETDMAALAASIEDIGSNIQPHCLTLIETTVAPGTTEYIAWPILKRAFKNRGLTETPLLAHSFERVMPGREYVSSIRDFWRVCSGCDEEARSRVEKFLREVLNTDEFPLTVLDRPLESETAKIVENSYRATILAFMNEWSLFAERNGVDMIKVYKAIKMRPTHSNIMFPGPGIGGYCLPKDGGLGYWAYKHILTFNDGDDVFKITPQAIDINDTRSLHVVELARDSLRTMDKYIAGSEILVCGASYRQDVGDTRYSGSELVVRKLAEMGAWVRVHDPYVERWQEFENQNDPAEKEVTFKRFFRNQDGLEKLKVSQDLSRSLPGCEVVIFAVPHSQYLDLDPDEIVRQAGGPLAVIDCFGILSDEKIVRYLELDCEVMGLGRGHISHLKKQVRNHKSGS